MGTNDAQPAGGRLAALLRGRPRPSPRRPAQAGAKESGLPKRQWLIVRCSLLVTGSTGRGSKALTPNPLQSGLVGFPPLSATNYEQRTTNNEQRTTNKFGLSFSLIPLY